MTISIHQIHPVFVGEVSGIDITSPISREEVTAIDAGMDRDAVLVFRDQKLTDELQMAFTRQLGLLENARGGNITKPEDRRLTVGMNDVSNLGKDGRLLERDSRQRTFELRPRPHVAPVGLRHVGQPADHASRAPLRRPSAARYATHHARGRRAHCRAGRGEVTSELRLARRDEIGGP